jgi:hypothetical protein
VDSELHSFLTSIEEDFGEREYIGWRGVVGIVDFFDGDA